MAGIQVPPDSTGKVVDTVTLSDAGSEVHRQKMVITGGSGTAEIVTVGMSAPAASAMGLTVRHAGTATVAGTVNVNGAVGISGTAIVAISTPYTIQGISTTVTVVGIVNLSATAAVVLAAGTANFGTLNDISRTVQVAIATPFTINNISATSVVAGSLNISGSVQVSGSVNIFTTGEVPSASRGPRMVIASTSANVTLVAAPGAGLAIFVTHVGVSNAGGSNTRARVGSSATPGNVTMMLAASGGGYVMQFTPPWQLSANEALLGSVKPNVSEGLFNIHFFVGSADAF